jgi:hypothetical protein
LLNFVNVVGEHGRMGCVLGIMFEGCAAD